MVDNTWKLVLIIIQNFAVHVLQIAPIVVQAIDVISNFRQAVV